MFITYWPPSLASALSCDYFSCGFHGWVFFIYYFFFIIQTSAPTNKTKLILHFLIAFIHLIHLISLICVRFGRNGTCDFDTIRIFYYYGILRVSCVPSDSFTVSTVILFILISLSILESLEKFIRHFVQNSSGSPVGSCSLTPWLCHPSLSLTSCSIKVTMIHFQNIVITQ